MASFLVPTLSSLSTKEDAVGNKRSLALSQTDSQETGRVTRSKTSKEPKLEVPQNLYLFIQEALSLEKQMKDKDRSICSDLESKLLDVMSKIDVVSRFYRTLGHLPSDWEYHPDTASICVPITCHPVPAEKKPKKLPRNPYMQSVPLDELGQKAWSEFKKRDEDAKITALTAIRYPNPGQDKKPVEMTSRLVRFISDFAVDAFNKCYQMYINERNKKNVSDAKVVDCKYLKYEDFYLFYVTLEALEQGNPGVYETRVKCEFDDGAINLDTFVLKEHKPSVEGAKFSPESTYETVTGAKFSPESTYETVIDGSTDEKSFYPVSGMAPRRNKGCGYNFLNPCGSNRWIGY